ncbi:MAG TPA: hypothetical protein VGP47_00395 [Parachlamydiaceae bacterium]|nr:hypothetical protein [Parachlamydiaceae bacterium]
MNEQMSMLICMIITMLFVIVIGIAIIIQTFLQAKMLKEIRLLNANENDQRLNR